MIQPKKKTSASDKKNASSALDATFFASFVASSR